MDPAMRSGCSTVALPSDGGGVSPSSRDPSENTQLPAWHHLMLVLLFTSCVFLFFGGEPAHPGVAMHCEVSPTRVECSTYKTEAKVLLQLYENHGAPPPPQPPTQIT